MKWKMEGPTPYFGDDNQFYVITNDEDDELLILIDATPLSNALEEKAERIFQLIKGM